MKAEICEKKALEVKAEAILKETTYVFVLYRL
jgi:hypothetical protein